MASINDAIKSAQEKVRVEVMERGDKENLYRLTFLLGKRIDLELDGKVLAINQAAEIAEITRIFEEYHGTLQQLSTEVLTKKLSNGKEIYEG